jgi:hypothetical protein
MVADCDLSLLLQPEPDMEGDPYLQAGLRSFFHVPLAPEDHGPYTFPGKDLSLPHGQWLIHKRNLQG